MVLSKVGQMFLKHVFLHDEGISSELKILQLSQLHFFHSSIFSQDRPLSFLTY